MLTFKRISGLLVAAAIAVLMIFCFSTGVFADDNDAKADQHNPAPVEKIGDTVTTDDVESEDRGKVDGINNDENQTKQESAVKSSESSDGWYKDDAGDFHYRRNGSDIVNAWLSYKGQWYYFRSDGKMTIGDTWLGGTGYHFNNDGSMVTGWYYYGGN